MHSDKRQTNGIDYNEQIQVIYATEKSLHKELNELKRKITSIHPEWKITAIGLTKDSGHSIGLIEDRFTAVINFESKNSQK